MNLFFSWVIEILKIIKNTNVSLAEGVCNHIHQRILVPIPISQYMVGTSLPHPIRNTELRALVFYSYQIQLSNIAISVQLTGRELHIFRHFLLSIISSLQLVIRINWKENHFRAEDSVQIIIEISRMTTKVLEVLRYFISISNGQG